MNAWMSMERDATGICPECLEPVARWADACPCVERKEAEATRLEEASIRRMIMAGLAEEALRDMKAICSSLAGASL